MPEISQTTPATSEPTTPTMAECNDCGASFPMTDFISGEAMQAPDGAVCASCAQEYSTCEHCNNLIHSDDTMTVFTRRGNEEIICTTCARNDCTCCACCGDLSYTNDIITTHSGDGICQSCYEDNYFTCDGCGEIYHNDDYAEDGYCENCYYDDEEIESYQGIKFVKGNAPGRIIKLGQLVGVEIEAEADGARTADGLPEEVNYHPDGSLNHGLEFVTWPASRNELERIVTDTCRAIEDNGYFIRPTCGLHIHLDNRDIAGNEAEQDRLSLVYLLFEDLLYAMLPGSRQHNQYCYKLRDQANLTEAELKTAQARWSKCKSKDLKKTRYQAVNFQALSEHGTIEIRSHSGTLDPEKILRWIDIHQRIQKFARDMTYSDVEYFLRARKPKTRLERMAKLIKLSKDTHAYIIGRINKFNPGMIPAESRG